MTSRGHNRCPEEVLLNYVQREKFESKKDMGKISPIEFGRAHSRTARIDFPGSKAERVVVKPVYLSHRINTFFHLGRVQLIIRN